CVAHRLEALLALVEALRIELDAIGVMSQRISGFAQLCFPRFEHGNGIAQQSIEFGERAQPRKYSRQRTERGVLRLGKRVDRVPNALHEGRCVGSRPCSDWIVSHSPGASASRD